MELIVFDLDGTLLNRRGAISDYTRDTLAALAADGVAYTVATGRTLHAARDLLAPHGFRLPHVYKNGVMIWHPDSETFSHQNVLTPHEIEHVLHAVLGQKVTPFIFTVQPGHRHAVYHTPLQNEIEEKLAREFVGRHEVAVHPASELPADAEITNISALGAAEAIHAIEEVIRPEPHLVAYAGEAWDGDDWRWIDIHHADANKGSAVDTLRETLGASRIVCFGDNDNDLPMFERADESYAPENAARHVREAATAVIGHHDEDGIARFLRERFALPD